MSKQDFALSQRAEQGQPSSTIALMELAAELKRQGKSVVSLVAGEPDYGTPEPAGRAAIQAIQGGDTRYSAVAGTAPLRAALSRKLKEDNRLDYPASQILVAAGTKPLLHAALLAVTDPGTEVIVPAPYWVSYPELVRLAGATPVVVASSPETGFKLTPQSLRDALTPQTRALILNTPNNPSGAVYSADELTALFVVLADYPRVAIITDEIYEHLSYGSEGHIGPAQLAGDLLQRLIVIHGFSKGYGLIGWRVGFSAGPKPIIDAMSGFVSHLVGSPSTISQAAALAALELPPAHFDQIRREYGQRRDLLVSAIEAIDGLSVTAPDGAFFVFADVRALFGRTTPAGTVIGSDEDFSRALIAEQGAVVVPGTAFGLPGFARISYAIAKNEIEEGVARIARFVAALRRGR